MDQPSWNTFVVAHGPRSGAFLQSLGWKQIQQAAGKTVVEIGSSSAGFQSLWIAGELPLGMRYWYCPRGPITTSATQASLRTSVMSAIDQLPPGDFLRLDLPLLAEDPIGEWGVPRQTATKYLQPPTTLLTPVSKSVEDRHGEMHPKTRYNIRVAQKNALRVQFGGEELFEHFWSLLEQTAKRDQFGLHSKNYYQAILSGSNDPDLQVQVAVAFDQEAPAAAAMIVDFGKTRTYLHGASEYRLREKMAPYALHEAIQQDAQQKGIDWYDWWGIAQSDSTDDPLYGVTRFKKGWGGEVIRYCPTQDLILRPWKYRMYSALRRLRP